MAALTERTEDWVTRLQLAALSLRGTANAVQFIEGFRGSHRYILDHLTEEVLRQQPDNVRQFLLETLILTQLSGPLGNTVTGRSDSQTMLEYRERANLFLVPLDKERHWYRYHHLFADLHRKADAWYKVAQLVGDALRHALAAGRYFDTHF